jgi:D-alanine transfer protein
VKAASPRPTPHFLPAALAILLAAVLVAAGLLYSGRLERRYIHALAGEFTDAKLQGIVLQKQAFSEPELLVLYGSSELVKEMPNNATDFFADYPTGFRVFPVGKPGATSLTVLQRIAAVGEGVKGKKLAFSISPGWFFTEIFDPKYYEGNFSEMQAAEVAYSSDLSHGLKRDIARRMIEFPNTLENRDLLDWALHRLAGDSTADRVLYALSWPIGKACNAIACGQDHAEVAFHIFDKEEKLNDRPRRVSKRVAWKDVLKTAARFANVAATQSKQKAAAMQRQKIPRASRDKAFIQTIAKAREWTDVELLMRTIKELKAEPLLLSMPVEDIRLDVYGISPDARAAYIQRLAGLAHQYGYPLLDFHEHQNDPSFLVDFLDHLSGSGWLYYNKALDDFFHGRVSTL